ncbi:MAG: response regulator [Oligoflexales bacterium]|nr:response regulator [Oligoflexales bacterium]
MSSKNVLRALVVEDQEDLRLMVIDALIFLGFETLSAGDGAEAFDLTQSTHFDVILSDIRMPNRDGRWFLSELRNVKKMFPPFLFMSGFSDFAIHDAFDMGVDGFLEKPVDSDRLAFMLAKSCRPPETRWLDKPQEVPVQHIAKFVADGASHQISIGRGGFFVAMEAPTLKVGDVISFELRFSDGPLTLLEGIGSVVWRRKQVSGDLLAGCGISLDYISPNSLTAWLAYLDAGDIIPFIPNGRLSPGVKGTDSSS